MTEDTKFIATMVVTFLSGGVIGWALKHLEQWWAKPDVVIEYGPGYPFVSTAKFDRGDQGDFVRVRVHNKGRTTAQQCKCYVRNITLIKGGSRHSLPSEDLMLGSWVPREEQVTLKNLPAHSSFFADVAYARKGQTDLKVTPVFNIANANFSEFTDHVGEFELEFVVLGENIPPVHRVIKFAFDGGSASLKAVS